MTDWSEVVRRHGPLVWRTAYRLLSHEADAADCFQRTFLAAVELATAQPVRSWPAALARLATARALEQLRKRYRESGRLAGPVGEPPAGHPGPVELAEAGELAEALRVAMTEIDPAQAEVFCLVCLEGLPNGDAADQLGLTANHAGVLLHRARAALRDKLRAFDPNPQPEGHHE
jgi:RNA polymerase sigma-70 factor (ECF subfamily)